MENQLQKSVELGKKGGKTKGKANVDIKEKDDDINVELFDEESQKGKASPVR